MAIDTKIYVLDRPPYKPVKQLHQHLPLLSNFYTDFEKNYNVIPINNWSKKTWPMVPLLMVAVYLVAIFAGRKVMEKKQVPKSSRVQLAWWNLFLSIFSFMGAIRTVPHLLYNLWSLPFEENICTDINNSNWGTFSTGFWVQLFIFSKPLELFDTYFIVVKKKPLLFLHWYHHVTVLLFCWHSYAFESSTGLFFVAMNYSVHCVMVSQLFVVCRLSFVVCRSSFVVCRLSFVVCRSSFVVRRLSFVVRHSSFVVRRSSFVVWSLVCSILFSNLTLREQYFYYFLTAARMKPKWYKPALITMAQISQMVVGVGVCCSSWYYKVHSVECHIKMDNIWSGVIMYSSYFVLFFKFAIDRYVLVGDDNNNKAEEKRKKRL